MWSGPEAATSLRPPPDTGLFDDVDGDMELLDELLQAASPSAATLAIAMTAIRWERRVMSKLLLAWRWAQAYPWSPSVSTRIVGGCLPRGRKRSGAFMQPQSGCDHRTHSVTIALHARKTATMPPSGHAASEGLRQGTLTPRGRSASARTSPAPRPARPRAPSRRRSRSPRP